MSAKKVDFVALKGGIDLASTVLQKPPGTALTLTNFEPELEGGYRRINGYVRFDGRASPIDAVYYVVTVADATGIAVGDTLTGGTSAATSKVVIKSGNSLGVTALTGGYTLSETANGTTITAIQVESGQTDPDIDAEWQLAAENYYRNLIGAVPGTGNVLGVVQYLGNAYAFRADAGTVKMYKSSVSGWVLVTFYHYIFFDGGVLAAGDIVAGDTVTGATSGTSATVKKFVKNAGNYGSTASGYMVLQVNSGTFQNNENIQKGGVTKCVADGANVAISLAVGGSFNFIMHNFYASSSTRYLYGCDGVNFAWEFDGTTLCPIFYPAPDEHPSWNAPTYIEAFRSHLFLAYSLGTVAHSSPGEPLIFSGLLGASEFGVGDEPTGMVSRAGNVLAIYTRSATFGIYGTSSIDWELRVISDTFGAKHSTAQKVGTVYALDDKGIAPLDRVDAFGDFESATVSRFVKPILDQYKDAIVASVVVKERNQYRLVFSDGYILVMGDDQYLGDALPAFTMLKYPDIPTCISNSDDASGNEVILFGDASGYVYRAEQGYNFDGDAIEWFFRTPYLNQGSPQIHKSYFKAWVDVDAERNFSAAMYFDLSYGSRYSPTNTGETSDFAGGGGFYDLSNWDEVFWDSEEISSVGASLAGNGKNISLLFYGNSVYTRPFTIQTIQIEHIPRRLNSGK